MGLNSSYIAVRGNNLMMTPFPSMSQAYSLLVQQERQRQVKTETHFLNENASLSAGISKKPLMPKRFDNRRQALFCDHCKRTGHTIEKRYKIHGYLPKTHGRKRGGYG